MDSQANHRPGSLIAGIRYAVPAKRVTNAELAELHPTWDMPRVVNRTGVESRYWCDASQTALDLGESACRKLIGETGLKLGPGDALLFCTQTPDHIMPPNACLLQSRLGLPKSIAALDFTLACSGFIYGLYLADSLVRSGSARNVLLVTAETYSRWMHPEDRGTMTLFGDGGAATWITLGGDGVGSFVLGTDGAGASAFCIPAGGARIARSGASAAPIVDQSGNVRTSERIHMNGGAVLDFVKKEIPALALSLLDRSSLTFADIDLVIFHQASALALDYLYARLHIPLEKQFRDIADFGNTVSASIPITLRDAHERGVLKSGMRIMVIGFGVGLSWGGCIISWRG